MGCLEVFRSLEWISDENHLRLFWGSTVTKELLNVVYWEKSWARALHSRNARKQLRDLGKCYPNICLMIPVLCKLSLALSKGAATSPQPASQPSVSATQSVVFVMPGSHTNCPGEYSPGVNTFHGGSTMAAEHNIPSRYNCVFSGGHSKGMHSMVGRLGSWPATLLPSFPIQYNLY